MGCTNPYISSRVTPNPEDGWDVLIPTYPLELHLTLRIAPGARTQEDVLIHTQPLELHPEVGRYVLIHTQPLELHPEVGRSTVCTVYGVLYGIHIL